MATVDNYKNFNRKNSKREKKDNPRMVRPHSDSAEKALLGAMLTTPEAVSIGIEVIKVPEYFFSPTHQKIFKTILLIYGQGKNIDYLTVSEYLEAQVEEEGEETPKIDKSDLFNMRSDSPAPSHAIDYANIVKDHYIRRNLISAAESVIDLVYEEREKSVGEVIDEAEGLIYQATQERLTSSTHKIGELYEEYMRYLENLYDEGGSITGLATGFNDLDSMLSGLQRQNLVIVGARPAQGKTSLALGMACHIAKVKPVLFFSMEMSGTEITRRIVAQETGVGNQTLMTGNLSGQEWKTVASRMEEFKKAQLYIDDNPALTVLEVRAKARRLKAEIGDLGAIFVDYIQLMTLSGKSESRQVEVSSISRDLKILARELDCPVVGLSQLSRGVESRVSKRPLLADLRESGSIEQDADIVMFLYREAEYDPNSKQQNFVDLIIAKHRSGPTGNIRLMWFPDHTRFGNSSYNEPPPEISRQKEEQLI